jgi:alkylhydroperoxidase/carboxymuconolactone decarboxylase family protein YurZ
MGQMARFQETLRRLAMIDEGFVEDPAGFGRGLAGISALDPKTPASLQVGVSAALGSPAVCLEWCTGRALAAGASEEEIADVLPAIAHGSREFSWYPARPSAPSRAGHERASNAGEEGSHGHSRTGRLAGQARQPPARTSSVWTPSGDRPRIARI